MTAYWLMWIFDRCCGCGSLMVLFVGVGVSLRECKCPTCIPPSHRNYCTTSSHRLERLHPFTWMGPSAWYQFRCSINNTERVYVHSTSWAKKKSCHGIKTTRYTTVKNGTPLQLSRRLPRKYGLRRKQSSRCRGCSTVRVSQKCIWRISCLLSNRWHKRYVDFCNKERVCNPALPFTFCLWKFYNREKKQDAAPVVGGTEGAEGAEGGDSGKSHYLKLVMDFAWRDVLLMILVVHVHFSIVRHPNEDQRVTFVCTTIKCY